MKKALKRHGPPEVITTNGLRSYKSAMTELSNAEKQQVGRWPTTGVENSHLRFRRRERAMLRFRQMKSLQKFAPVQANVHNHFNLERDLVDRTTYKERGSAALAQWQTPRLRQQHSKTELQRVETSSRQTESASDEV